MGIGKFIKKITGGGEPTANSSSGGKSKGASKKTGFLGRLIKPRALKKKEQPKTEPNPEVEALVESIREGLKKIPPLPEVVLQILRELNNPQSSAKSVARIAQSDPSLAAAMLRTVNSAMYGLRAKITSIDQAVTMLGFSTVRNLVIRLKLDQSFARDDDHGIYDADDLWVHAMAVADIAEILARRVPGVDRGFVATFGLMHDIGKMAINSQCPSDIGMKWRIAERANPLLASVDIEKKVFGNDHAGLGEFLADRWDLPVELSDAIGLHHHLHQPEKLANLKPELRQAIQIVHIANQLAKYCYIYAENMEIDPIAPEMLEELGLPPSIEELLDMKIKGAVSRAIFFAEESTERSLAAVRRTLKLTKGKEAVNLAGDYELNIGNEPRIVIEGDVTIEMMALLQQEDQDHYPEDDDFMPIYSMLDGKKPSIPDEDEFRMFGSSHMMGPLSEEGLVFMSDACTRHQKSMNVRPEVFLPSRFVTRRVLANLKNFENAAEKVDVIQTIQEDRLIVIFYCEALSFEHRLSADATEAQKKALIMGELGHLLNLGWFAWIEATDDGKGIMFVSDTI